MELSNVNIVDNEIEEITINGLLEVVYGLEENDYREMTEEQAKNTLEVYKTVFGFEEIVRKITLENVWNTN